MKNDFIDTLEKLIELRKKGSGDETSYTRKLFREGDEVIARKFGEESIEAITSFLTHASNFLDESADVLYHFLVMLHSKGYCFNDIVNLLLTRHEQFSKENKLVIFDFDGTLINTFDESYFAFKKIAELIGEEKLTKTQYRKAFGNTWESLVHILWPNQSASYIQKIYDQHHLSPKFYPLFPGVAKTLNKLKEKGYSIGIVSSRDKNSIKKRLIQNNVDPIIFSFIISSDSSKYVKPNPKVFEPVYKIYKPEKTKIYYIGDLPSDYQSAKKSGIDKFYAFINDKNFRDEFISAGLKPDSCFHSYAELLKKLT